VDLPVSKERAYTDPQLQYGVLSFTTNIPDDSPCSIYGGSSWLNYLDYATGGAIKLASGTYATAGRYLGNMLASRGTIIWINGKPYVTGTNTDGSIFNFELPTPGTSKRVSWREVVSN
jgi:type IV pilus assembly protein PilY1